MNAPDHYSPPLTRQEMMDLISALEHAHDDASHYFEHGGADEDYVGDEESLAEYKAMVTRWSALLTTLNREVYGS